MSKRKDSQILNIIETKGCLEFPFNFLGVTISENTAAGAEAKKLAADNGKSLCSAIKIQKEVFKGCKLKGKFASVKDSNPNLYKVAANGDCNSNDVYVCAVSTNDPTGACLDYEPKDAILGANCECKGDI
jgi:hypothetical protein